MTVTILFKKIFLMKMVRLTASVAIMYLPGGEIVAALEVPDEKTTLMVISWFK